MSPPRYRPQDTVSPLQSARLAAGLSQVELAARSGVSRSEISAIETGKLAPSVKHALALARALGTTVEHLFSEKPSADADSRVLPEDGRLWRIESPWRTTLIPCEPTSAGVFPHDAVVSGGRIETRRHRLPARTLLIAGCDPATGILGDFLRSFDFRLIPLQRGSEAALELLRDGNIDAAGIHIGHPVKGVSKMGGNVAAVRSKLGDGYTLLRIARWSEGVAASSSDIRHLGRRSIARTRWAAREPGSAARQLLDSLLEDQGLDRRFPRVVRDHRTLAQIVRDGWADAGICIEFAATEAGLDFLPLREEAYDLCIPRAILDEAPIRALIGAVRSKDYRRLLADLPGYDVSETGELVDV